MAETAPCVLVVSAHAGDFVWRAGGAIAAARRGERAIVVCLSYGERGESASRGGRASRSTRSRRIRRDEAERPRPPLWVPRSGSSTPATIRCSRPTEWSTARRVYRDVQPDRRADPHAGRPVQRRPPGGRPDGAAGPGAGAGDRLTRRPPGEPALGAPPVFFFEPHQPEQCDFKPERAARHHRRLPDASARRWSACPPSSTCGTTTPIWPSAAACSSSATPGRTSGLPHDDGRGVHAAATRR